jgi:hypothetical protein
LAAAQPVAWICTSVLKATVTCTDNCQSLNICIGFELNRKSKGASKASSTILPDCTHQRLIQKEGRHARNIGHVAKVPI